jgi:hypothetical protein
MLGWFILLNPSQDFLITPYIGEFINTLTNTVYGTTTQAASYQHLIADFLHPKSSSVSTVSAASGLSKMAASFPPSLSRTGVSSASVSFQHGSTPL